MTLLAFLLAVITLVKEAAAFLHYFKKTETSRLIVNLEFFLNFGASECLYKKS